jgi:phage gpG-like protein
MAILVQRNATEKQMKRGGGPPTPNGPPLKRRKSILAGSIIPDYSQLPRVATVGPHVPYGDVHEFGSLDGFTPPRPYMRPALAATQSKFAPIVVTVLNEEMRNRS